MEGEVGEDNKVFVCVCIEERENRGEEKESEREKAIVVIMIPPGFQGWAECVCRGGERERESEIYSQKTGLAY